MTEVENLVDVGSSESSDDEGAASDPYVLYRNAWELLKKGEFLQSFPEFELSFDSARSSNDLEFFKHAIEDFTNAIGEGKISNPSYIYCYRAMSFSSLTEYSKAVTDMSKAIELEKEPVIKGGFHFHRGLIRNKHGELEGAVDDFTQAMNLDPDGSTNAIVFRFLVNYKLGRKDRMREDYRTIEEMENVPEQFMEDIRHIASRIMTDNEDEMLSPEEKRVVTTLRTEDKSVGLDGKEGEEEVEEGDDLGLPPDVYIPPEVQEEVDSMTNPEKLVGLKASLSKFENMTKEKDENAIVEYLKSGEMGRMSLLLDWFNSEAKHWKDKFEKAKGLVRMEKKYREAIPILTECMEFEPDHVETIYLRGVCHYHLDEVEPAFRDVGEAIRRDPNNPRFYSLLGYIMVSTGELSNSISAFKKAIEVNREESSNHEFYYILAILYEKVEEIGMSMTMIDKALALQPRKGEYVDFKDKLTSLGGKYEGGEEKKKKKKEKTRETEEEGEEADMDMSWYQREFEKEMKKKRDLESKLEKLKEIEEMEKTKWSDVQNYLKNGGDENVTLEYLRTLAGSDDEEVDEEGEMSDDEEGHRNIIKDEDEDEGEEEEEDTNRMTPRVERREKILDRVLSNGNDIIKDVLDALQLGHFYSNFTQKNVIWFDVIHGYLTDEDYNEVFPRKRFTRRFKTYVEKYVIKTDV